MSSDEIPAEMVEKWKKQQEEWDSISSELIKAADGGFVSAHMVSAEQRKRAAARGERLMTYTELCESQEEIDG